MKEAQDPRGRPNSLGALMTAYRKSTWFMDLEPRTRSDYQKHMDYFQTIGDMPVKLITTPFVANLRDQMVRDKSWDFSKRKMSFISVLMRLAVELGLVSKNPVDGMKSLKSRNLKRQLTVRGQTMSEKKCLNTLLRT